MIRWLVAGLLFCGLSQAAITIDNHASAAAAAGGSTSLTLSNYVTGSGATLMVVVVPNYCGVADSISSITWNTTSNLTKDIRENDGIHSASVEIWSLINPPPATANVVVTFNACGASLAWGALVITFKGTSTSSPVYGATGSVVMNGTSISDSVTVARTGDYLLDGVAVNTNGSATPGGSQTKYTIAENGVAQDASSLATSGTGATAMSWSYAATAAANAHAVIGIAQPSTGSGNLILE